MQQPVYLEEHEVRKIVRETVHEVLHEVGADGNLADLQQDFHYLRRQRRGSEEVTRRIKGGLVAMIFMTVVPTALWLLFEGVKALLHKG